MPLPTLPQDEDLRYVFRTIYYAYSPYCHPLVQVEEAKKTLEGFWLVPTLTTEYDMLLRAFLLLRLCQCLPNQIIDPQGPSADKEWRTYSIGIAVAETCPS